MATATAAVTAASTGQITLRGSTELVAEFFRTCGYRTRRLISQPEANQDIPHRQVEAVCRPDYAVNRYSRKAA